MKQKLLFLALALALCISLSIPALADFTPFTISDTQGSIDFESLSPDYAESGKGWSYDGQSAITLNGFNGPEIYCEYIETERLDIILSPGSKNIASVLQLNTWGSDTIKIAASISGSGELIINGTTSDHPTPFICAGVPLTLKDGLVMTGGASASDSQPLTINKDGYPVTPSGAYAKYIRIAPPAGAASNTSGQFTDVAANSPYKKAIDWAVKEGITKGLTNTTFGPGSPCTVSQILTFLWRAEGQPGTSAAEWAKSIGIDAGRLDAPCTRSMAVSYIWKAAGSPSGSKVSFTDVPANANYAPAVNWAVEAGITSGKTAATFAPDEVCTRGQIVTFLCRAKT